MKSIRLLLLSSLLVAQGHTANAEEIKKAPKPQPTPAETSQEETKEEKTADQRWRAFAAGAFTTGGKTDYDISVNAVTVSSSDKAKSQYQVSGELEYLVHPHFSVGGELAYSPYRYKEGGESDSHLGFQAVPRLRFGTGMKVESWFGIGLGYMHTSIGGPLSGATAGYTASIPERGLGGFVWSPRVGTDFDFTTWLLRVQVEYLMTQASTPYTLVNTASGVKAASGDINISRKWWVIGVGFGWKFDF